MNEKSGITKAGWQGIVAEVPEDWCLSAVSGEDKEGYFRIDSTRSLVLEAKWSKFTGTANLQSRLAAYLEDLKKKAKKRKLDFEFKIKAKDEDVLNFSWRSDRKAQGKMWKCDNCSRIMIAQLSGAVNEDVSIEASKIFPTIVDHGDDDWRIWGVYGLVTEVPPGYALEKHQLMSGYIQLVFRRKTDRIMVERWGLANTVLKGTNLKDWFMLRSIHELRPYRFTIENVQFEDEQGLQIAGRRSSIKEHLRTAFEFVTLQKPSYKLDGYVWRCEESNKIFSVQTMHSKKENVIDEILERTVCH